MVAGGKRSAATGSQWTMTRRPAGAQDFDKLDSPPFATQGGLHRVWALFQ